MNQLQQTAKKYAEGDRKGFPYSESSEIYKVRHNAFLAGAEYASGAFAEWLCKNKWQPLTDNRWSKLEQPIYTTPELYQLWQQSL